MLLSLAIFLICTGGFVHSAVLSDLITSLPGWPANISLPSKQYSGYLNISSSSDSAVEDIHLHYWLVQAEKDPDTAPVVIWFNGGPGCSSLDGFFYEQGPFEILSSDGTQDYAVDGVYLTLREYRWSRIANMLYIEQPVGVGFSYASGDNVTVAELYASNTDDNSAQRNLLAVNKFFELYPEYLKNDFYIAGESYAGIYVPTLAYDIVTAPESNYTG
eukprot:gene24327-31652_t